jgi:hypothetical protein
MRDGQAGPVETANTCHFGLSVSNVRRVDRLLGFKCTVDAFSGNDKLPFVVEYKGRIVSVKNNDVNLVTERAFAINHVCSLSFISLWKVGL